MQVQGKNKAVEIRRIKRERLSQQRENRADKQGNGQVVVDFDFIFIHFRKGGDKGGQNAGVGYRQNEIADNHNEEGADKKCGGSLNGFVFIKAAAAVSFAEEGGTGVGNKHDAQSNDCDIGRKEQGTGNCRQHDVCTAAELKLTVFEFFVAERAVEQKAESPSGPAPFFVVAVFKDNVADENGGKDDNADAGLYEINQSRNPQRTQVDQFTGQFFFERFVDINVKIGCQNLGVQGRTAEFVFVIVNVKAVFSDFHFWPFNGCAG